MINVFYDSNKKGEQTFPYYLSKHTLTILGAASEYNKYVYGELVPAGELEPLYTLDRRIGLTLPETVILFNQASAEAHMEQ